MKISTLYPLVFDALKDPLVLIDPNGVIILTNAAALSFFSFGDSHTVSSMSCAEPGCVFDAAEVNAVMKQHQSIRDYALRNWNGQNSGVVLDIDSVYMSDGQPEYKLLHFRNRSAERSSELWRDEMISMVSHEIKNPLSAMKNSVEILLSQEPGELTAGQKRFLDTSGRSIDRLTHLLDGFLDVSRISAGAFEFNRKVVDIREFIGDVINSFTTLFNAERVNLDWSVEAEVGQGYLDPQKLEQVIINLLGNSLKFTPADGDISVSIRPAGVEKVDEEIRLLPWDSLGTPRLLEIVVEDNGLGMSNETLDHLFNRYHRTGDAGHGRGAHLGLSISKALVEAQDGWLDIVSQLGLGTKVSVFIPQNRHTACLMSRCRTAHGLVTTALGARRPASLYVLGKLDVENWKDICGSWPRVPVVNPRRDESGGNTFH
ncbi:MAG: HAMP domain-containing histidine kinase, partial [Candidatus Krumholzibacteria bacterium]|nr:HAMP domain-containing histidine kinase [Candidatus Krumholzibacteria bacterium]